MHVVIRLQRLTPLKEKVKRSHGQHRKKVQPKEGKGLPTWRSGANPAHLGPGSYEEATGFNSRAAIVVGGLNEFSSSFRCEEPRSIDFRVVGGWVGRCAVLDCRGGWALS